MSGEENAVRYSIDDLLMATSLVVKGKTSERMRLMFDMARGCSGKNARVGDDDINSGGVCKKEDVVNLTGWLFVRICVMLVIILPIECGVL